MKKQSLNATHIILLSTIIFSPITIANVVKTTISPTSTFIPDLPKLPPKEVKTFIPDLPPIKPKK